MRTAESACQPYPFSAALTLCLDIKNPLSYLALQPAYAMAEELALELHCLPFSVAPLRQPRTSSTDDDRGTRHRNFRAKYLEHDIFRYARVQNLTLKNIYRAPDSTAFELGLLWLNQQCPQRVQDYLCIGFEQYWNERLDIESIAAIGTLLKQRNGVSDGFVPFAHSEGPSRLSEVHEGLVAAGIHEVPSFVAQGQIFVGRAHAPLLRRLLRSGQKKLPGER